MFIENGGLVFYNSDMNQSTAVRDAVKENLKKVGVKFVQDFQFWMRGSMPYLAENEAEISDEKTKDLSDDSLKKLANKLKFTTEYRETPWITSNKFFSLLTDLAKKSIKQTEWKH
nr:hypothetical protein [Mycoplasmopsis bovis]